MDLKLTIKARVSCNVLEEDADHVAELEFDAADGRLIRSRVLQEGCFDLRPADLDALAAAVERDPTGEHPEVWTEVQDPRTGEWLCFGLRGRTIRELALCQAA